MIFPGVTRVRLPSVPRFDRFKDPCRNGSSVRQHQLSNYLLSERCSCRREKNHAPSVQLACPILLLLRSTP